MHKITEPIFQSWYIKQRIGQGSFGTVYEIERKEEILDVAYHAALKVITVPQISSEIDSLHGEGMTDQDVSEYYKGVVRDIISEFILLEKLKGDSHVVSYEDHELRQHEDGIGWDILIRMELLEPFLEYENKHPIDKDEAIRLGIELCRALELCQEYNIIHRDIKPENIFVSPSGNYKLGDFGIARTVEKTSSDLSIKGTYAYMAPEVYNGEEYGPSVDICSLGIVLYRLFNKNRTPFLPPYPQKITYSEKEDAKNRRMRGEPLSPPCDADDETAAVILKACAYDPNDRFSSAAEFREALEQLMEKGENSVLTVVPSAAEPTEDFLSASPPEPTEPPEEPGGTVILVAASAGEILKPAKEAKVVDVKRGPARTAEPPKSAPPKFEARYNSDSRMVHKIQPAPGKKKRSPLIYVLVCVLALALGFGTAAAITHVLHKDKKKEVKKAAVVTEEPKKKEEPKQEPEPEPDPDIVENEAAKHVYAHKGTCGDETLKSYEKAVEQGAQYIEQDVRYNGEGDDLYVSHDKLSYDELKDQKKPKLRDVFDLFGTDVTYVVEVKSSVEENSSKKSTGKKLVSLIKEYEYEDNVIVQCFDTDVLKTVKSKLPDVETMYLCDDGHEGKAGFKAALKMPYVDEVFVSYEEGYMTKKNCDKAHKKGKAFGAWQLDKESEIKKAIKMGADAYFTTHPARAIKLEKKYRKK